MSRRARQVKAKIENAPPMTFGRHRV